MNAALVWLFRPFERLSSRQALLPGVLVLLVVAALANAAGLETDAILSLHFADDMGLGALITQGLVNWLIMAACLFLAARLLEVQPLNLADFLGNQAFARWPLLLSVLYLSFPPVNERMQQLTNDLLAAMPTQPGQVMADAAILIAYGLPVLITLIWMTWLMLQGFGTATRLKGPQAVFPFAASLLVAQILSLGLNT